MEVYLATENRHKFDELSGMVAASRVKVDLRSAADLGGLPEVEESSDSFEGNARLKAEALAAKVPPGSRILADDSGLEVDALDGAPGVRSARYVGPEGNSLANNLKLLSELRFLPMEERTAQFRCVLYFLEVGRRAKVFEGICEGHILRVPAGHNGFGYDPIFRPFGCQKTFAELAPAEKNTISHRARAMAQWIEYLNKMND